MRFLVDNPVSPRVAEALRSAGHDTVHVRELGMHKDADDVILVRARAEDRVVLSADTDFGTLIARGDFAKPSCLLLRRTDNRPDSLIAVVLNNLRMIEQALTDGSVVVIDDRRIRIRRLPMGIRETPPQPK